MSEKGARLEKNVRLIAKKNHKNDLEKSK